MITLKPTRNTQPIPIRLQLEKSAVSLHNFTNTGCVYILKYDSMCCAPSLQGYKLWIILSL